MDDLPGTVAGKDHDDETSNQVTKGSGSSDDAGNDNFIIDNGYDHNNDDEDTDDENNSEPSEFVPVDKFDKMPFHRLCNNLEKIWRHKVAGGRNNAFRKTSAKLEQLMPQTMLESLRKSDATLFPYVRLLVPDADTSRQFMMKDKKIIEMYSRSFGWIKGSKNHTALTKFKDPGVPGVPANRSGDLSLVIELALESKLPTKTYSKLSISQINEYLDRLASIRSRGFKAHHNHRWRTGSSGQSNPANDKGKPGNPYVKKLTDNQQRVAWLDELREKMLSPLEHKWLIRIILGDKIDIGVGVVKMLEWYSPFGKDLWNAHNNLKKVCTLLANPKYVQKRKRLEEERKEQEAGRVSLWQPQVQPAKLGSTLIPNHCIRTYFDRLMTNTQAAHQMYLKRFYHPENGSNHKPLSLRCPALSVEIKLDGERLMVHIDNGRVTMNTRNAKWYSPLYSPVLGPYLRKAIAAYPNIKLMLDGEVEAWDDKKQAIVPFGDNRTVAENRRSYLKKTNGIEDIDKDLHVGDTDPSIQWPSNNQNFSNRPDKTKAEKEILGKHQWNKAIFFDILLVDGPDARRLLDDCGLEGVKPGSIIHLPLLNRKQILYRLIEEQKNHVEIIPSIVVRPNGTRAAPEEYYNVANPMMDLGFVASFLDSTCNTIEGRIPNLEDVDKERMIDKTTMKEKKIAEINMERSRRIDEYYKIIVDDHKYEGLVVKDLAAPYIFRERKFWWKFKPDYETDGVNDIDVAVLGCSFAYGRKYGGTPSSFLLGVVDSRSRDEDDAPTFMTLCTINAGGLKDAIREMVWRRTGFQKATEDSEMNPGKWFEEKNFNLPSFISRSTWQYFDDHDRATAVLRNSGWKFDKTNTYPDRWIKPEDSIVLTIKGAEFVRSDEHSCGITLRFPRITNVRMHEAGSDEKDVWEVETDNDIWNIYKKESREQRGSSISQHTQQYSQGYDVSGNKVVPHRFLTPEELVRQNRKKRSAKVELQARAVPVVEQPDTSALEGLTFIVLEGNYSLSMDGFDAREGRQKGWYDDASRVRSEADVIFFLKTHGGEYRAVPTGKDNEFLIGGENYDARVTNMIEGLRKIKRGGTTKRQKVEKEKCQNIDGILKWTYIYNLVYRWKELVRQKVNAESAEGVLDQNDSDYEDSSLLEIGDNILTPGPEQYLIKVSTDTTIEQELFNLDRPLSALEMERTLNLPVDESHASIPWQYHAVKELDESERWIMATNETKLWPYRKQVDENEMDISTSDLSKKPVVLYPDIFNDNFGLNSEDESFDKIMSGIESARWQDVWKGPYADEILSVLPRSNSMGALVSPHLHNGVTHVVCSLKDGLKSISFQVGVEPESKLSGIHQDDRRGNRLKDRIISVIPSNQTVTLVSPSWIIEKWET